MSTAVVLFEDVEPFSDLYFPITFRAQIEFGTSQSWEVEGFETQGSRGGWVGIPPGHALRPVLEAYVAAEAANEVIESQIAKEIDAWRGCRDLCSASFA